MKKRIKAAPALGFLLLLALIIAGAGKTLALSAGKHFIEEEKKMPETAMEGLLEDLVSGDFSDLYRETQAVRPNLDSEAGYTAYLEGLLNHYGREALTYRNVDGEWRVYAGDTYLAEAVVQEDGEGNMHAALPLEGNGTAVIEVPAGAELKINGNVLGKEYLKESDVPAVNCEQFPVSTEKVSVDVYEIGPLLGEPEADEWVLLKDVLSGHYLAGKEVTDDVLLEEMIRDAELLAAYPAQDASLAQVAAVSLTNTTWYSRYATLQNYWFTSHSTSEFSNAQVLKAVYQSDDVIAAHIVFDYYADNGEVHRTWHCGYQLTFVQTENGWKIAGTAINNELNPATVLPQ